VSPSPWTDAPPQLHGTRARAGVGERADVAVGLQRLELLRSQHEHTHVLAQEDRAARLGVGDAEDALVAAGDGHVLRRRQLRELLPVPQAGDPERQGLVRGVVQQDHPAARAVPRRGDVVARALRIEPERAGAVERTAAQLVDRAVGEGAQDDHAPT
jgi:hypothetical protein